MSDFWGFVTANPTSLKEMSLDDKIAKIRAEISKQINPQTPGNTVPYVGGNEYWIYQTFPDYVIVSKGVDYFKMAYRCEGDSVVLGTMIPVEMMWVPKSVTSPEDGGSSAMIQS